MLDNTWVLHPRVQGGISFTRTCFLNPESALYSLYGYSEGEYLQARMLGYEAEVRSNRLRANGKLYPNHVTNHASDAATACRYIDRAICKFRKWPKVLIDANLS